MKTRARHMQSTFISKIRISCVSPLTNFHLEHMHFWCKATLLVLHNINFISYQRAYKITYERLLQSLKRARILRLAIKNFH